MNRKIYIDNLRSICILLLFPYHAAMAWNCWGEGNYILLEPNKWISSFVVAVSPWYMTLLFLLAGISTKYSLEKRSAKQYKKERSFKLLLPALAGTLTVMPVLTYIADKTTYGYTGTFSEHYLIFFTKWTDLTGYDGGFGIGHLWFLLYLYIISILSSFLIEFQKKSFSKKCTLNLISSRKISFKLNVPVIILLCFMAMLLMPIELGGKSILTYSFFYLLGYYVFAEEKNIESLTRLKYPFFMIFIISTYFNVYLFLWSASQYKTINTTAKYFSGVFGILSFIIFGKEHLEKSNKKTKYFASQSFLIYIFHFPWVVLFQFFFRQIIANSFILLTVSVLCSFAATLATGQIIKQIPAVQYFFGKKPR